MTPDTKPEDLTGRTVRIKPYNPRDVHMNPDSPGYQPYAACDVGIVKETDFRDNHLAYRVYVFYKPEPLGRETGTGMWFRRQDLEVVDG